MGFWGNLADEAGKKTGKAIGNSLFGSAAADQTININGNVKGGRSDDGDDDDNDSGSKIEDQIRLETHRKNQEKEEELLNMEFDNADIQHNYKLLFKLMPMVDAYVKNDDKELYQLARSKYESGLMMCQMLDAANPSILMLQGKLKEWDTIVIKKKKNMMIMAAAPFVGLVALAGLIWLLIWLFD